MTSFTEAQDEFARSLRDLAAAHADLAECHSRLHTDISTLLELGKEADHDEEMRELADSLRDDADSHDDLVGVHGDYAAFFFRMAELFERGEWEYTDLRMIDEMMESAPRVAVE